MQREYCSPKDGLPANKLIKGHSGPTKEVICVIETKKKCVSDDHSGITFWSN